MAEHWYALRSKPRKEEVVWRQVRTQGYEIFYPRLKVNPVNPRARKLRPYFPGYMFVSVDLGEAGLSTFQWMPHAMGIVCFGEEPAIVPEHLIHAIRKRVDEIAAAGIMNFFGGVTIHGKHLNGFEALAQTPKIQEDPQSSLQAQKAILDSLCKSIFNRSSNIDLPKIQSQVSSHLLSNLDLEEKAKEWQKMIMTGNRRICEFPSSNEKSHSGSYP